MTEEYNTKKSPPIELLRATGRRIPRDKKRSGMAFVFWPFRRGPSGREPGRPKYRVQIDDFEIQRCPRRGSAVKLGDKKKSEVFFNIF